LPERASATATADSSLRSARQLPVARKSKSKGNGNSRFFAALSKAVAGCRLPVARKSKSKGNGNSNSKSNGKSRFFARNSGGFALMNIDGMEKDDG
jgi:hypothetical protein